MTFPLLEETLGGLAAPIDVFFRDDDVGWADDQLMVLCDLFANRAPLDLAVIPMAVEAPLASNLLDHHGRLGFHQHGYTHMNHQLEGKKCELADSRPAEVIALEIEAGQLKLRKLLGDRLDPIFTPPWNRCGAVAAEAILQLGIRVLSRDAGATPFAIPGLIELPVGVDWVKLARGQDGSGPERWQPLDRALVTAAAAAADGQPVGVMLHHEVMGEDDFAAIDTLIELLSGHRNVALKSMAELTLERVS